MGGEYKTHLFPHEEEITQAEREITEFSKNNMSKILVRSSELGANSCGVIRCNGAVKARWASGITHLGRWRA